MYAASSIAWRAISYGEAHVDIKPNQEGFGGIFIEIVLEEFSEKYCYIDKNDRYIWELSLDLE